MGSGQGFGSLAELLLLADPTGIDARRRDGETALHLAVRAGRKDVAALLSADEADINAMDRDGWTPLHFAADWGDREVEQLLLSYNADVNAKKNNKGQTPLQVLARSARPEGPG